jgi:hypothetical protein
MQPERGPACVPNSMQGMMQGYRGGGESVQGGLQMGQGQQDTGLYPQHPGEHSSRQMDVEQPQAGRCRSAGV